MPRLLTGTGANPAYNMPYYIEKGHILRLRIIVISIVALFALAACNSSSLPTIQDLPEGDAARGEILFHEGINGAPACSSCHHTNSETLVGPGLQGVSERASTRVEGLSAKEYILTSILQPANFVVSGFSNLMYTGYHSKLSSQNLADLIAYLLTL